MEQKLLHKLESLLKKFNDIDINCSKDEIVRIKETVEHELEDCIELLKDEDLLE